MVGSAILVIVTGHSNAPKYRSARRALEPTVPATTVVAAGGITPTKAEEVDVDGTPATGPMLLLLLLPRDKLLLVGACKGSVGTATGITLGFS